MDYIIDKLSEKIRLERDSLIKFTYLRARVEYIYYFLLGYYWNENHDNLSLNDLKCFVDKLNCNLTLGSIVHNIKLFSNGKFLADEEKILYKYVKFRNSNFGHGYTFDECINDVLDEFFNDLTKEIDVLKEDYEIAVITTKENNNYEGVFRDTRGKGYRFACPVEELGELSDLPNRVFARFQTDEGIYIYHEISPFILVENDGDDALVFFQLINKLSGQTTYSYLWKSEKTNKTIKTFIDGTGINKENMKISSNGTIMNYFSKNYDNYYDVGIKENVIDFITNNGSNVSGILCGNGGVGKTACVQKVCDDLFNEESKNKRPFEYIVFISAKDRRFNPITGRIENFNNNQSYISIINTIYTTMFNESENSISLQERENRIKSLTPSKGKTGADKSLLLIIDDFETFSDEEQSKINAFISGLDSSRHKVIITTRNLRLTGGYNFPVSSLSKEDTIKFLHDEIERNHRNYIKYYDDLVQSEENKEKLYETTERGIPIFILQWITLFVQNPTESSLLNSSLGTRKEAKEFLTGRIYDTIMKNSRVMYCAISQVVKEPELTFTKKQLYEVCKKYYTTDDDFNNALKELEDLHIIDRYKGDGISKSDSVYSLFLKSHLEDMRNRFVNLDKNLQESIKTKADKLSNSDDVYTSLLYDAEKKKIDKSETEVVSAYRHLLNIEDCPIEIKESALDELVRFYFQRKENGEDIIKLFEEFKTFFYHSPKLMYDTIYCLWGTTSEEDKNYDYSLINAYIKQIKAISSENVRTYSLGLGYYIKHYIDTKQSLRDHSFIDESGDKLFEYITHLNSESDKNSVKRCSHEIQIALHKIIELYSVLSKYDIKLINKLRTIGNFFIESYPNYNGISRIKSLMRIIVNFTFGHSYIDKYNKYQGVVGYIDNNNTQAFLHISNLCDRFITQEEFCYFVDALKAKKSIKVELIGEFNGKTNVSLKGVTPGFDDIVKQEPSNDFFEDTTDNIDSLIGEVVTIENVECTTRNTLRGDVVGQPFSVSISKTSLEKNSIYAPKDYEGKKLKVRITKWDDNAKKFNSDYISIV